MDDDVWPVVMEALSAIQDVPNLSHQFGAKKRVARGGYSEVYRAEWIQSGTRAPVNVCYKVLKPPISNMPSDVEEMRKTMKHLRREMKVWKDLDHENIVKFIGFAIDDRNGGPEAALVSEWCSNGNLDQYLRCKGSCNRMALVLDVARGLTYLHGRDSVVVHGDLKPPNILISDTGHAKLCDFGLSSIADGMTTGFTSSGPAFTLRYCAPEAVVTDNHVKTTAGDVYSFACTCAMILFNEKPFPSLTNDAQVFKALECGQLPWDWKPSSPLEKILSSCCAVSPDARPRMWDVSRSLEICAEPDSSSILEMSGPETNLPLPPPPTDSFLTPDGDRTSLELAMSKETTTKKQKQAELLPKVTPEPLETEEQMAEFPSKTAQQSSPASPLHTSTTVYSETFHTIRRMVDEGLEDCISESLWKPSEDDLDTFASACRGLPVMASTRIREVCARTERGATLKSEFDYFRNLMDAPTDLKSEYLRILRRAYMRDSRPIHPSVIERYRLVVGTIALVRRSLSSYSISRLLEIMEVEVYSTLKPISSIVHLPQRITEAPRFYHATAKEFIIGEPIGDASDQSFFINDTNGYSLGLSLLRFLKSTFKWNDLAMPTDRPLGNKEKWEEFQGKGQPDHVEYAVKYLFSHLDPSKLFSRDSNELQQEFDHFLTNNLLSFIALSGGEFELPDELLQSNNHDSTELLREAKRAHEYVIERHERLRDRRALFSRLQFGEHDVPWTFDPWHIFRSMLPFTRPTSSPLFKLYRHLADPIRIFTISGEFTGHLIPLSKHAINAQNVMETKLSGLRKAFDSEGPEIINYRAQYSDPDICKGIVTSTAISKDGRYIALGFGNGGIEVVDIDQQHAITQFQCDLRDPIAWIDFISGSCRIAAEDDEGNIFIFDRGLQPLKLGTLPGGHYPPVTAVADNGSFIIRLPRHLGSNWYKSVAILYVLEEPSIHILSFPSTIPTPLRLNSPHGPVPPFPPPVPCGLALKLSPGARYVVACDREHAFVWSTESCEFITSHNLLDFEAFVTNTAPYRPYIISGNVKSSKGSIPHIQGSRTENDIDASWVELLFHRLSQKKAYVRERQEPLGVLKPKLWLRNTLELILPIEYHPVLLTRELRNRPQEWYGDRVIGGEDFVYFPHASKDGTRFLVQGHMRAPIVVDISQIV